VLCTFGFVDDVMFSHNGANRPETKTTCMFRPVRQVTAPVGLRQHCLVEFDTWRHWERSLLSSTASCLRLKLFHDTRCMMIKFVSRRSDNFSDNLVVYTVRYDTIQ